MSVFLAHGANLHNVQVDNDRSSIALSQPQWKKPFICPSSTCLSLGSVLYRESSLISQNMTDTNAHCVDDYTIAWICTQPRAKQGGAEAYGLDRPPGPFCQSTNPIY